MSHISLRLTISRLIDLRDNIKGIDTDPNKLREYDLNDLEVIQSAIDFLRQYERIKKIL